MKNEKLYEKHPFNFRVMYTNDLFYIIFHNYLSNHNKIL